MTTATAMGTLEHIDPQLLAIEQNVRTSVDLDDAFLASIKEMGVLTPILAYRTTDGSIQVRAGQRRTSAAKQLGLVTVPVYLVDAAQDGAERIIEQLIENEHRQELGEADRIAAWQQLEFEGMSVTQIAKRTGTGRDRIKTGLSVAANKTSTGLVADFGLTLDQAATLIEFEDDSELVAELTHTATENPSYFPVAVERARQDRADRAACAAVEAEEQGKGHQILTERPDADSPLTPIYKLETSEGKTVRHENVQQLPGLSVHVRTLWNHEVTIDYYLEDYAAHGFVLASYYSSAPQKGPMTEEQKAERKTLIANNKEWAAATVVRREWLAALLSRKTLPKDAAVAIATALAGANHLVSTALSHGNTLARELLGATEGGSDALTTYLDKHRPRALHVALAVTLGGIEENTSRDSWRYPREDTAAYLNTLAEWGYTLTPVERIAANLTDEPDTPGCAATSCAPRGRRCHGEAATRRDTPRAPHAPLAGRAAPAGAAGRHRGRP